jgi:hypothetical protein
VAPQVRGQRRRSICEHVVVQIAASAGTLSFCFSIAPDDCRVVYTSGITQRAGDAISFGFIGISEIARSLP